MRPTENGVSSASRAPELAVVPEAAASSKHPVGHEDLANMKPSRLPFSKTAAVANGTQSEAVLNSLADDFRRVSLTGGPETG